ncbi:MAG: bifunctional folylpolyglutamate synthase/dihydrofolate synthase [Bacteroidales bacterium]|nr:bifunctional folylpolyglutamate synthase/dihydrofolate synthase [Bacteroidales bacterium]
MKYKLVLEYLMNQLPMYQRIGKAAYKANLDNSHKLDRHLNFPHKKYKTIHVAGTNGKGSVSHMLASVLQQSGYKVGLHTSPHLLDFRERIKVNGELADKDFVIDFTEANKQFFEKIQPSFFEMSVFMAFEYFARKKVDVAVIEVGMGGRLDSTNVILPELSVITNIGFDHMEFLGDSLEKIAAEKAGIIKKRVPVVIGETQDHTKDVFIQIARKNQAPLVFADQLYSVDYTLFSSDNVYQILQTKYDDNLLAYPIETDLLGKYQVQNIITSLAAVDELKMSDFTISDDNLRKGLKQVKKNTGLQGRWDIVGVNPRTICDVAHNADGLKLVLKQLLNIPYKKLHLVLGFVSDKNVKEILTFFPESALYYFTEASVPRAMEAATLARLAAGIGLEGNSYKDVHAAYKAARNNSGKDDLIFIGGSTFLVADFRREKI